MLTFSHLSALTLAKICVLKPTLLTGQSATSGRLHINSLIELLHCELLILIEGLALQL